MILSQKKIEQARKYATDKGNAELAVMTKYNLINFIEDYGVRISPYCDIDRVTILHIAQDVIDGVINKYGK